MPGNVQHPEGPSAAWCDSLGTEIEAIFLESKKRHGAAWIHAELKHRDFRISKRTVARLMREKGIRPPRGRMRVPITTDSRHSHAIAPNLLEQKFDIALPDTVWLADISHIPTDEGWLYLAAVKDLATTDSDVERQITRNGLDQRMGELTQACKLLTTSGAWDEA